MDKRQRLKTSANSGCSDIEPEIYLQNYGFDNLTEVTIDVSVNGSLQYSTVYNTTSNWNSSTNSYDPLDLATLEIDNVKLSPVYDLSNNDIIQIDVYLPNGMQDSDPSNNQTISMVVDLGFDNAYWDGSLSIDVTGNNGNSWYLKQVSDNLIIASGFGGVVGSTNFFPLTFDECYTLQSVANDVSYIGASYTVTDANGQVILQGTTSQLEEFDNFSTGAEIWTSIHDNNLTEVKVFPSPVDNNLFFEGSYEYIEIFDLLGRSLIINDYKEVVDVSSLSNGFYILNIHNGDEITYEKFEVRR